jgi:CheY-like chemotaxis protein
MGPAPHPATKPILVVEDDAGIRTLLSVVLQRAGFETHAVGSGREALDAIGQRAYGAALLDLFMPGLNGFDVLRDLQTTAPDFLSCIIVLSAVAPAAIRKEEVTERVFRVMSKPFELEDLVATMAACVNARIEAPAVIATATDPFLGIRRASTEASATAGLVGMVDESRTNIELVWSFGYDAHSVAPYNPLPLTKDTPLGTAVLEQQPVWVGSLEQASSRYASIVPMMRDNTAQALAVAPIVANQLVVGCIGWSFREPQPFEERQRWLLLRIAREYATVLENGSSGHD